MTTAAAILLPPTAGRLTEPRYIIKKGKIKMEYKMRKKLFISGAVTGVPYAWKKFDEARLFYANMGYAVTVPTDLPVGMSNADYARICLAMIDSADEVAFLPGWEESDGAKLEHAYCRYVGKPTRYYQSGERREESGDEPPAAGRQSSGIAFERDAEGKVFIPGAKVDEEKCRKVWNERIEALHRWYAEKEGRSMLPDFEALFAEKEQRDRAESGVRRAEMKEDFCRRDEVVTKQEFMAAVIGRAFGLGYRVDLSYDENGWISATMEPPAPCPPLGPEAILVRKTFDEEAACGKTSLDWIPAKDRKPEDSRDVLVLFRNVEGGRKVVRVGWFASPPNRWSDGTWKIHGMHDAVAEIIAWAELPEMPKE